MAIRIVLDSASDISSQEALSFRGIVLPLSVHFKNEHYLDGVTVSHREFYNKLEASDVFPSTSQVPPYDYEEAFRKITEDGDEVLCLTVSSAVSGCYQSAVMASGKFKEKVKVVDTLSVSLGIRALAELAHIYIEKGYKLEEVQNIIEKEKHNIRVIAKLETLEYLKKGGRISATVAFAGGLLGIKPLITVNDKGEVALLGKRRGSKNANALLTKIIEDEGGINFDYPYFVAYSGDFRAELEEYLEDNRNIYSGYTNEVKIYTIGATIGAHAGPGAIEAAFFVNKRSVK